MKFLITLLNGKGVSTTRLITVATAFTILGVYISQNIMAMTKCGGYVDFPANSIMALLVVMGAKVGQTIFGEKTASAVPVSPVAPEAPVTTTTTMAPKVTD